MHGDILKENLYKIFISTSSVNGYFYAPIAFSWGASF
jgi:hypothetical protein